MKKIIIIFIVLLITSCGYHLRTNNTLVAAYPIIKINVSTQSLLKRSLSNAIISSGAKLANSSGDDVTSLDISKDILQKIVQSVGTNNQVQEYRLEYDVNYSIAGAETKSIHLEKDYSFDIQQISGGQQEELTLRKQLAEDMAWAIIRQINISSQASQE